MADPELTDFSRYNGDILGRKHDPNASKVLEKALALHNSDLAASRNEIGSEPQTAPIPLEPQTPQEQG